MIYAQAERFLGKKVFVITPTKNKVCGTLNKCDKDYGFVLTKHGKEVRAPLRIIYPR